MKTINGLKIQNEDYIFASATSATYDSIGNDISTFYQPKLDEIQLSAINQIDELILKTATLENQINILLKHYEDESEAVKNLH